MERIDTVITVVDRRAVSWPPAQHLLRLGVSPFMVRRYVKVRRHFESGLKRVGRESRN